LRASQKQRLEEEHRNNILHSWLLGRSFDLALQANQDLPPTKKEATRKKPDWPKVEKARKDAEEFIKDYRRHYSHPHLYEKYMGLNPVFDEPEQPPSVDMKVITKEQREARKREIQAMEKRLVDSMYAIEKVYGNIRFDQMQPS